MRLNFPPLVILAVALASCSYNGRGGYSALAASIPNIKTVKADFGIPGLHHHGRDVVDGQERRQRQADEHPLEPAPAWPTYLKRGQEWSEIPKKGHGKKGDLQDDKSGISNSPKRSSSDHAETNHFPPPVHGPPGSGQSTERRSSDHTYATHFPPPTTGPGKPGTRDDLKEDPSGRNIESRSSDHTEATHFPPPTTGPGKPGHGRSLSKSQFTSPWQQPSTAPFLAFERDVQDEHRWHKEPFPILPRKGDVKICWDPPCGGTGHTVIPRSHGRATNWGEDGLAVSHVGREEQPSEAGNGVKIARDARLGVEDVERATNLQEMLFEPFPKDGGNPIHRRREFSARNGEPGDRFGPGGGGPIGKGHKRDEHVDTEHVQPKVNVEDHPLPRFSRQGGLPIKHPVPKNK
ncbi:unnamed protein product [Sympodiomycopsis kandeliae]